MPCSSQDRRQRRLHRAIARAGKHEHPLGARQATQPGEHRLDRAPVIAPGDRDAMPEVGRGRRGHNEHRPVGGKQGGANACQRGAVLVPARAFDHQEIGAAARAPRPSASAIAVDVDPPGGCGHVQWPLRPTRRIAPARRSTRLLACAHLRFTLFGKHLFAERRPLLRAECCTSQRTDTAHRRADRRDAAAAFSTPAAAPG